MKGLCIFLMLSLILSGCAGAGSVAEQTERPEQILSVCTPLENRILRPLVREFQERTGIWVTVEQGSAGELAQQFRRDPDQFDVLFGFDPADLRTAEEGLVCIGEDGSKWSCVFYQMPVIVCNPYLIRRNFPTGFRDLSAERWQSSIVLADPVGNPLSRSVLFLLRTAVESDQAMLQFGRNLLEPAETAAEVLDRVSNGTAALGIAPESDVTAASEVGASLVRIDPQEGSCLLPVGMGISVKARNPDAAQAFLKFLLEETTQSYIRDTLHLRPVRFCEEAADEFRILEPLSMDACSKVMDLWSQMTEEMP